MSNFYKENVDLKETGLDRNNKRRDTHTFGHLNKPLNYYIHKELPMVIGIYEFTVKKYNQCTTFVNFEVICLKTGLVLKSSHEYYKVAWLTVHWQKLGLQCFYIGTYRPLDPELHIKIKNKREQRYNNNKK